MPQMSIRIDLDTGFRVGPGKIALLEAIERVGSISGGGRALGMSYRRAWLLVDGLNNAFTAAVIDTRQGGAAGGGAALTPFGRDLVAGYRAMEQAADAASRHHIAMMQAAAKPATSP